MSLATEVVVQREPPPIGIDKASVEQMVALRVLIQTWGEDGGGNRSLYWLQDEDDLRVLFIENETHLQGEYTIARSGAVQEWPDA